MKNIDLTAWTVKFFSLLFVILLPIRSSLIAVFCLVIADLISGVWASIKEKKKITSSGLRRTCVKLLSYESAILVSFVLETYLLSGIPITKVVSGVIGITEGKSFFENMKRITGIDFWAQLSGMLNMQDIKNSVDSNNEPKQ